MYGRVEALYVIRVYKSCKNDEQRKQVKDWFWKIKNNFDVGLRMCILISLTLGLT